MASKFKHLVLNGCSYAEMYSAGSGHKDLATRLGMESAQSLALGGSANSRILRTTAKHAHHNTVPTFYLLGLTFLARWELPIAENRRSKDFEGRWINPQAQYGEERQWNWTDEDTAKYTEINFKSVVLAHDDMFEDLIYRCLGLRDFLWSRGHKVLFFNYCDKEAAQSAVQPRFEWFKNHVEFVEQYTWQATPWQHANGVEPTDYFLNKNVDVTKLPPPELAHRASGKHNLINEFLTNYIQQHRILE